MRQPIKKVYDWRAFEQTERRANLGQPHRGETAFRAGRNSKREPKKKKRWRGCSLRRGLVPLQGLQARHRQPLSPKGVNGATVRPLQEPDKGNGGEEPEQHA